ncbi:MAG: hypothetical protein ACO1SX_20675 [Actinomycetota bacterium]
MTDRARSILVILVFAATLAAASAPYLYGGHIRPPGSRFWAVPMVNYYDANQYLALTKQASAGRVLLGDPFTAEPHAPRLLLPEVLAEGALCRWLGVSPLGAFHISRVACGALLLAAGWWLGALLLPEWRRRWLFLALLCFSAGVGWLSDILGGPPNHGDAWQPEANTFHTLANLPHLSLSAALLTFLFATLVSWTQREGAPDPGGGAKGWTRRTQEHAAVAAGACLLGWTHPFDFVTYAGAVCVYGVALAASDRKLLRPLARHTLVTGIGALPAAVYLGWVVATDPFYRSLADDPSTVQHFSYYAIAHGALLLPALLVPLDVPSRRRLLLPMCWVGFAFLVLLLPLRLGGKQPRLLGGVHAPLALLAAVGIDLLACAAASRSPQRGRGLAYGAVCVLCVGAPISGAWGIIDRQCDWYARREPDFYLSPAVVRLFDRLAQVAPRRTALALGGPYTGGWAPALGDARVYCGHWQMTLDEPRKRAEQKRFFTQRDDPRQKAAWLAENGVEWVIWYPWEWGGAGISPAGMPGLTAELVTPEISLFRFRPSEK